MSLPIIPFSTDGLLSVIPQSEKKRNGWPWTKESKPFPPSMSNDKPWPKISIVTPSYNQGQYLEETIRSVLLQNYPNLEYIIMDGGSTDNSVGIIKKYEPWLTYWVSEKDDGQADAIYRGFEKSSGEILAWINSDDFYMPNALARISLYFTRKPTSELANGGCFVVDPLGRKLGICHSFPQDFISLLCFPLRFPQPSSFWKREAFFTVGGFNRALQFCFDYDMFLRLAKRRKPNIVSEILASARVHSVSKTETILNTLGIQEAGLVQRYHGFDIVTDSVKRKVNKRAERRYRFFQRFGISGSSVTQILYWLALPLIEVRQFLIKWHNEPDSERSKFDVCNG